MTDDLTKQVQAGCLSFRVIDQEWNEDLTIRTIRKIRVGSVTLSVNWHDDYTDFAHPILDRHDA